MKNYQRSLKILNGENKMDFWFGFDWLTKIWCVISENIGIADIIGMGLVILLAVGFARGMD